MRNNGTSVVSSRTPQVIRQKFKSLNRLVGNTPLLGIEFAYRGQPRVIYAKCEQLNLTGSIKDRMALYILQQAYADQNIRPGDTIAEATSGNTGIAFAAFGRALGHPVIVYMPDWMSHERMDLIVSYGAKIVPVTRKEGGFLGSIRLCEEFAASHSGVFFPQQFTNAANIDAHQHTTGPEIWLQLQGKGLRPDAFVAGVGTGGTVMGVGRFLREKNPKVRIHPVEPRESPTLSTGSGVGHHRVQGISDEFIPAIVNLKELDTIIGVNDGDAILMAQRLAAELGLAVGISSGLNFLSALEVQNELAADAIVVTVFPDDNRKYLSTDLMRSEPIKDGYLSPDVTLNSIRVLPRVCELCTDSPARQSV